MNVQGLVRRNRRGFFGVSFGFTLVIFCLSARSLQSQLNLSTQTQAVSLIQPRQFSTVAHDTVHHQFFLFGGTYGSQRFSDTWQFGLNGWVVQKPPVSPTARISAAATYDSVHSQVVLFGGRVKQATPVMCAPGETPQRLKSEYFCGDTWVFTGQTWIKKTPATSPPAREGHAMAFDATRGQTVLFGGTAGGSAAPLNDTWIWNGSNWKQVFPTHHPPARLWHAMAYDPVHRQVVLFGGSTGSQMLNDTWLWNGTDWQAAGHQATPPELRTNAALDYDAASEKMVLFSGTVWSSPRSGAIALTSWSWDGTHWTKLPAASFQLVTDFSSIKPAQLRAAIVGNGTPSYLWTPVIK